MQDSLRRWMKLCLAPSNEFWDGTTRAQSLAEGQPAVTTGHSEHKKQGDQGANSHFIVHDFESAPEASTVQPPFRKLRNEKNQPVRGLLV